MNEYQDNASRFVSRLNAEDLWAKQIKGTLLMEGPKERITTKVPKFKNALVFRDSKENIEAIFHLCFETNCIQNEQGISMGTSEKQMQKLKSIIKSI